ncbi:MAG: rhodanese-like domain-containing protein [Nocardioidaceae bacterium]
MGRTRTGRSPARRRAGSGVVSLTERDRPEQQPQGDQDEPDTDEHVPRRGLAGVVDTVDAGAEHRAGEGGDHTDHDQGDAAVAERVAASSRGHHCEQPEGDGDHGHDGGGNEQDGVGGVTAGGGVRGDRARVVGEVGEDTAAGGDRVRAVGERRDRAEEGGDCRDERQLGSARRRRATQGSAALAPGSGRPTLLRLVLRWLVRRLLGRLTVRPLLAWSLLGRRRLWRVTLWRTLLVPTGRRALRITRRRTRRSPLLGWTLLWRLHPLLFLATVDCLAAYPKPARAAWQDVVMNDNSIPTVQVEGVPDPLPDDLTILDVRENDEWAAGHIEGAVHIPLAQLPGRVAEVPPDAQTLVYCKSGGRSAQATVFLKHAGRDAVNLDGGVIAWERAGRPLV